MDFRSVTRKWWSEKKENWIDICLFHNNVSLYNVILFFGNLTEKQNIFKFHCPVYQDQKRRSIIFFSRVGSFCWPFEVGLCYCWNRQWIVIIRDRWIWHIDSDDVKHLFLDSCFPMTSSSRLGNHLWWIKVFDWFNMSVFFLFSKK